MHHPRHGRPSFDHIYIYPDFLAPDLPVLSFVSEVKTENSPSRWANKDMGEVAEQMFPGYSTMLQVTSPLVAAYSGRIMDDRDDDDDFCHSITTSEDSNASGDSSSLDFADDATSSGSSSPAQVVLDEPLYQLSSLMENLPIKRGLSKFYQGKSQSFTSLSEARSVEDLAKRETPYGKRMKSCKSYAGGLDCQRSYAPGASTRGITKKGSRASYSSFFGKRNNSFTAGRPPTPVTKNSSFLLRSN